MNDVFVSPITASGPDEYVVDLAYDLALDNGGSVFQPTDAPADLADGIYNLVVDVCQTVYDYNSNSVLDKCDISGDTCEDCNANGISVECDGSCDP